MNTFMVDFPIKWIERGCPARTGQASNFAALQQSRKRSSPQYGVVGLVVPRDAFMNVGARHRASELVSSAVVNLQRALHPLERAHAGRGKQKPGHWPGFGKLVGADGIEPPTSSL
ncbi:MAG: hypothetical protein JSS47_08220 [Proteobacteria bacterium]|nr:hypothetical protein [Pseudomonadota bacterium]